METTETDSYNVYCMACGQVFTPPAGSSLWWRAKKAADKGRLDAISVNGEECGCIKPRHHPDAPFRVFGYDGMCEDFDFACYSFVEAVRACIKMNKEGCIVFITGVSDVVSDRLQFG